MPFPFARRPENPTGEPQPTSPATPRAVPAPIVEVRLPEPPEDPRKQRCDSCNKVSGHRFIDPIPTVEVNPQNPQEHRQYEKSLCGACYSLRYAQRFPGLVLRGVD